VDTIIGFKVIDSEKGEIGVVDQLSSPTSNPLIHIKVNFSEVMIPFVDEVVKKIDHKAQTIHVNCPEGLLDLYLD
jgi:16S rRNA processing protein RimM